jgi:uncharacterized protein with HEPN domain
MRIQDILDCVAKVERYTAGMTFETFLASDMTIDAVLRNIEIIGEAARYIPPEIEAKYPDVPWIEMRGMCNIVAHAYFGVSLSIVWDTVTRDLPPLPSLLKEILERES